MVITSIFIQDSHSPPITYIFLIQVLTSFMEICSSFVNPPNIGLGIPLNTESAVIQ